MPPFAFAMMQTNGVNPLWILIVSIASIAVAVGTSWLTGTKSYGRFEGAMLEHKESVNQRFEAQDKVNEDQWAKINQNAKDLGAVRERLVRVETKVGVQPVNGGVQ